MYGNSGGGIGRRLTNRAWELRSAVRSEQINSMQGANPCPQFQLK